MGRLCRVVVLLGLAGGLLLETGCATVPLMVLPEAGGPVAATGPDELPRGQAVAASLSVAQSLEGSGHEAGAVEQYEKVLQLEPTHFQAQRRLAVLYDRQGQFEKADAMYRKLVNARPKDADVYNDWGYSCYQRGKWAEGEKKLRLALQLDPTNARARCNLGLVLGQLKRYPEALECFRGVVSEAEAHCNLGFIYWTQYKLDEARQEYRKALELDRSCHKAEKALAELAKPPRVGNAGLASAGKKTTRRDREALRQEAMGFLAGANAAGVQLGGPTSLGGVPSAPAASGQQVIYTSPNGVGWVPVPRKAPPTAEVPPAAAGTEGHILLDQ